MLLLILYTPLGGREPQRYRWLLVQTLLLLSSCIAASLQQLPASAPPVMSTVQPFCASVLSISHAECEALVMLYENTDGPHWKTKNDWLTNIQPCAWAGVTCVEGRIEKLNLSDNSLRGPLPTALNGLRHLRQLYLNHNELSGPIPESLGELTELTILLLSANQLSGPIPENLGNLRKLLVLYLDANQLSGPIPANLGNLEQVRYLFLQTNRLQGPIPTTLGNLRNLQDLHLYENQLQGALPVSLAEIPNLQHVKLQANDMSLCLPAQLQEWASRRAIYEAPPGGVCK